MDRPRKVRRRHQGIRIPVRSEVELYSDADDFDPPPFSNFARRARAKVITKLMASPGIDAITLEESERTITLGRLAQPEGFPSTFAFALTVEGPASEHHVAFIGTDGGYQWMTDSAALLVDYFLDSLAECHDRLSSVSAGGATPITPDGGAMH